MKKSVLLILPVFVLVFECLKDYVYALFVFHSEANSNHSESLSIHSEIHHSIQVINPLLLQY